MDTLLRNHTIQKLRSAGFTFAQIAAKYDISRQRAHQLVGPRRKPPRSLRSVAYDSHAIVYFAAVQDYIKIGIALNPIRRMVSLQAMCPLPVRLIATTPGGRGREAELHQLFAASRHHGEWFRATDDLLDWIRNNATRIDS